MRYLCLVRLSEDKVWLVVEAISAAAAAYKAVGDSQPLELMPKHAEGVWNFRRFDAPPCDLWTVRVYHPSALEA